VCVYETRERDGERETKAWLTIGVVVERDLASLRQDEHGHLEARVIVGEHGHTQRVRQPLSSTESGSVHPGGASEGGVSEATGGRGGGGGGGGKGETDNRERGRTHALLTR